jgi:hypothetical protein
MKVAVYSEIERVSPVCFLWPEGPICPHCGLIGAAYKMRNKSQRPGVYQSVDRPPSGSIPLRHPMPA